MAQKEKIYELIYGIHPVIELLTAKRRSIYTIYTTKDRPKSWDVIERLLPKSAQLQVVSKDVLARLSQVTDHQGVVVYASPFPFRTKPFDPLKQPFLIMLDGVQDPRNVGAIIRSAYCTGINGIVMCRKSSAPLTAVALKASAGLAEHLEIYQTPSAAAAILELKKAGYNIYLATLNGTNATTITYQSPMCLVIGGEGFGISSDILHAGQKITLPQRRPDISYNASVAAGILLFLVSTQLHKM